MCWWLRWSCQFALSSCRARLTGDPHLRTRGRGAGCEPNHRLGQQRRRTPVAIRLKARLCSVHARSKTAEWRRVAEGPDLARCWAGDPAARTHRSQKQKRNDTVQSPPTKILHSLDRAIILTMILESKCGRILAFLTMRIPNHINIWAQLHVNNIPL